MNRTKTSATSTLLYIDKYKKPMEENVPIRKGKNIIRSWSGMKVTAKKENNPIDYLFLSNL